LIIKNFYGNQICGFGYTVMSAGGNSPNTQKVRGRLTEGKDKHERYVGSMAVTISILAQYQPLS
jgi:hypothetical protein